MKQLLQGFLVLTALLSGQTGWTAPSIAALPAGSWELASERNGIQVFSRNWPGSEVSAFKAVTTIHQPLASVLAVLSDATSCMNWVEDCAESGAIGPQNFAERKAYMRSNLPWPFSDRFVELNIRSKVKYPKSEQSPRVIEIIMQVAQNNEKETPEGSVRIEHSFSHYLLRALDDTRTEIEWTQHTEPAGYLPNWLINSRLTDFPVATLGNLRTLCASPRYQSVELVLDQDGQIQNIRLEDGSLLLSSGAPFSSRSFAYDISLPQSGYTLADIAQR